MKDKGLVRSTKNDLAQVEVECFIESCKSCSARTLCSRQAQSKGLLTVQNSLGARPGDEVEVEIPDTKYNKLLIFIFSFLLIASLAGMAAGYLLSPVLHLSSSASSLIGLLFALILAGGALFLYFRKKYKDKLYPVITEIFKKAA